MIAHPSPTPSRDGHLRKLWPLVLAVLLLTIVPLVIDHWASRDQAGANNSGDQTVTAMSARVIRNTQKTTLLVVAALSLLYFRKLVPVLSSVVLASLSGLLVAAEMVLILWLVYGGLASVGMPGLVWSPNPATMIHAAFSVTLSLYWMLYLLFVRDFEVHRHQPDRHVWVRFAPVLEASGLPGLLGSKTDGADSVLRLRWFLGYAGLPVLLALAIPAVMPAVRPGDGRVVIEWPWLAGMALGAGAIAALVWARVATRLHEVWRQLVSRQLQFRAVLDLDPDRLDPHANTKNIVIIVAIVVAASFLEPLVGHEIMHAIIPPVFSICVMLGVVATFVTYLGTRRWSARIVAVVVLLALVAAAGMLSYEVEIRDLHALYPSAFVQIRDQFVLPSPGDAVRAGVVSLERFQKEIPPGAAHRAWQERQALLDRWSRSFQNHAGTATASRQPILVVVTTSGGALRAAIWTQTVLGYLDRTFDDFPHHVRLITGASGGMLGAARYVSGHHDGTGVLGGPGKPLTVPDYLTPIAWHIAFRDFFPCSLVPWATYNRGDALEDAWIEFDDGIAHTFGEINRKEQEGLIPSIIFSPMLVEDGRRLLISNQPLHDLGVNLGSALLADDVHALREQFLKEAQAKGKPKPPTDDDLEYPELTSVSAVEFFGMFGEESRNRLRLATAVRMSATFPYVTSSVTLPTVPPRHVVDAGYYDNYGVNLAAAWIASHRDWIKMNTAGVLLVQIRAFRNEGRLKKLSTDIQEPSSGDGAIDTRGPWSARAFHLFPRLFSLVADGVKSVVIPFEGLATARSSSMYFRNDEQIVGLHAMFSNVTGDKEFFRSVIFTCDTVQSGQETQNVETLNWYIDARESENIRHNMEPYDPKRGVGRDRNALRVKTLQQWWRSREARKSGTAQGR
ncbi:MAG: hypothetical protein ACLQIB_27405 [Isosphaeraceae bacterium]